MAQSKTDTVTDSAYTYTKREKCVAAMGLLDHAGISPRLIDQIAGLLYDEIDDYDDCQQEGESYEACCERVEAEEKRLRDELTLKVEV